MCYRNRYNVYNPHLELKKELKEARKQTRQAQERHLAHLMKDSQNSSLPPSQDRRKRTRSLRERSGRRRAVKSATPAQPWASPVSPTA